MTHVSPRRRGALPGAVLAVALLLACSPEADSIPAATSAADSFLQAWTRRDFAEMTARFDRPSAGLWSRQRLKASFRRILAEGEISDLDVERVGPVRQPEAPSEEHAAGEARTSVEYSITYSSEAARRPFVFEGRIPMTFDDEAGVWRFGWSKVRLLPESPRARGFGIELRYPKRAAILDRAGRKLAMGAAGRRRYPFGSVAGTTVGHVGALSRDDLKDAPEGAEIGDLAGASGLEGSYDEQLAGTPAATLGLIDRNGKALAVLGRRAGEPGKPLETTLDMDVQRAAEAAYGSTVGGAVVMQPKTGDLLAVVSSSPFDPNDYVGLPDVVPFNRALSGQYPPGSSMKVVTASAALDTGVVTPATTVTGPKEYKGVSNFESGTFGEIPFSTALTNSVNTAFAQVAEKLGARRETRYAEAFGFNREPRMQLGAATPSFPFPEDEGDLMWGSIGQAQVLATPLQMASVAATVANGGRRMEPRIDLTATKRGTRVMARKTARTMSALMQSVVQGGTGTNAQIPGVAVAGKTGTAEVSIDGKIKNHAWFVAFAPAGAPKVSVSVVSELGGIGGQVAAPLARGILQSVLPLVH